MNLQLRPNEPSLSKEIYLDFNAEPPLRGRVILYGEKWSHGSPYKYNFYNICRLIKRTQRSALYNDFHKKIVELSRLEMGWDSYEADPPNYKALTNALEILNRLFELNFTPTRVMPSVEGGISFLFIRDVKYADIECDNDGDILAGMSDRTGEPILWEVSEGKSLEATISKINLFLDT